MKLITTLFLFSSTILFAQYTSIPDSNFENALSAYDDIAFDGQVPTANISSITSLSVNNNNISSLIGIQDFVSLTYLSCGDNLLTNLNITSNTSLTTLLCDHNQLSSLDVSSNLNLTTLWASNNQLTTSTFNFSSNTSLTELTCGNNLLSGIDISSNTALIKFNCSGNQIGLLNVSSNSSLEVLSCSSNFLTALNVSSNLALTDLFCDGNQITNLDLSPNPVLFDLICSNNNLTTLNVNNGNNTNFIFFYSVGNPNLPCIIVDSDTYSDNNWSSYKDSTSAFVNNQTACATLSNEDFFKINFNIYPNPVKGNLTVSILEESSYSLITLNGQVIKQGVLKIGKNTVNISSLSNGLYFLQVETAKGISTKKIVKQN